MKTILYPSPTGANNFAALHSRSHVEALASVPGSKVLEVGTGSGYVTALLSEMASHVYSIERHERFLERAREILAELGCQNVTLRSGGWRRGLAEFAPFDAILVSAATPVIPPAYLLNYGKVAAWSSLWVRVSARTPTRREAQWLAAHSNTRGCRFVPLVVDDLTSKITDSSYASSAFTIETVAFFRNLRITLEMIKWEHSCFCSAIRPLRRHAGREWYPAGRTLLWIVVAMVCARSAAMAFNRLADASIDAENPRTRTRALPAGTLSPAFVATFVLVSMRVFVLAAARLNRLTLLLSPVALAVVLLYSYTKRFTRWSHLFLGSRSGIAPAAAGSPCAAASMPASFCSPLRSLSGSLDLTCCTAVRTTTTTAMRAAFGPALFRHCRRRCGLPGCFT